jgi:hypothetical protein
VNRPFYGVFTMRDQFNNSISVADREAFESVIAADLTYGVFYDNRKCMQYIPDQSYKIICNFEALYPADD